MRGRPVGVKDPRAQPSPESRKATTMSATSKPEDRQKFSEKATEEKTHGDTSRKGTHFGRRPIFLGVKDDEEGRERPRGSFLRHGDLECKGENPGRVITCQTGITTEKK